VASPSAICKHGGHRRTEAKLVCRINGVQQEEFAWNGDPHVPKEIDICIIVFLVTEHGLKKRVYQ
jgi:hypothetical protein